MTIEEIEEEDAKPPAKKEEKKKRAAPEEPRPRRRSPCQEGERGEDPGKKGGEEEGGSQARDSGFRRQAAQARVQERHGDPQRSMGQVGGKKASPQEGDDEVRR